MPVALELLNRQIMFESAVGHESNLLKKLSYVAETRKVYAYLFERTGDIQTLIAHHLGVDRSRCIVSHWNKWIRGSFNVCIPVVVEGQQTTTVLFRCPMAYRLGENGSVDEKIGCEVATYAWMQDNCSEIRIPHLFGFGFTDGRTFTHTAHRPFYTRIIRALRRWLCSILRFPCPSHYVYHHTSQPLKTGYLLLQWVESNEGEMLSTSWKEHLDDPARRANLFRGLARITLALARVPQSQIGSFTFHNNGTITLSNRPVTSTIAIMESFGVPRVINPKTTYSTVEPYISDLMTYQDRRFLNQPNAIFNLADGQAQVAEHGILRAIGHHFLRPELRNGPFVLSFTDLHQSNIFVDKFWNITYIIDLEWICSLPVDMVLAPHWLTDRGVDELKNDALERYNDAYQEYLHALEEEDKRRPEQHGISLTEVTQSGWKDGRFWFFQCLTSLNGIYTIFPHIFAKFHLQELSDDTTSTLSQFWHPDSHSILREKLLDKDKYDEELRLLFGKESTC